jgi:DNA repair photolyase
MNSEKNLFENKGLKFDQERVLTYSSLKCPLNCRYCFVEDMSHEQENHTAYLSDEQFELLTKLPEEITLIMLGCDTEFFQNKKNALEILEKILKLNKDISVITKLSLPSEFIDKLKSINDDMKTRGNVLSFSVSIPCAQSAVLWEPDAPSFEKRVETLKEASSSGLMTMVAIRPLLPDVSDAELEKIVNATKEYAHGYYSGPLYLKNTDAFDLKNRVPDLKIVRMQPHWMPKNNEFDKVEREGQMGILKAILNKHGKPLFEGAAEGMNNLRSNEKH